MKRIRTIWIYHLLPTNDALLKIKDQDILTLPFQ